MSIKITPTAGLLPQTGVVFTMKNSFDFHTLEIAGGFLKEKYQRKRETNVKIKCIFK